jgi:hypothetical protein
MLSFSLISGGSMCSTFRLFKISIFSMAVFGWALTYAETFFGPTELADKTFDELTINGPAELKLVKTKSLTVHGPLSYDDLEVSGKTSLHGAAKGQKGKFNTVSTKGPFKAEKVSLHSLTAWGPVWLKDFTIEGEAAIHGPLKAEKGVFQDFIAGSENGGESVELTDVAAKNIVINEGKAEEILLLSGNTVISGNVIFKSGRGRIDKKGENNVIQGKIEGAVNSGAVK